MTATAAATRSRFARAFTAHLTNEFRLLLREPAALIFGAALPLIAITALSAIPATRRPMENFGNLSVVQSYVPTIALFASSVLGLIVLPTILGGYREVGILRRLRATPSSPTGLLGAVFVLVAGFAVLVAGFVVAIPALFGAGLPPDLGWFALAAMLSLVAFCALGTVLAAVVPSPKVAAGLGNVVAALNWFAAGMWYPRALFPDRLATATDLLPGGAAAKAMVEATGGAATTWQPILVLVGWTVVCGAIAARSFRWE